ncbi:hypothetical protein DL95DRAFT_472325 [Leptodontidium sp. 2 PMI_412]|nr:hypothetical protein DL95DRAFT_472325 [Leptodontidium sp. 2 PMI_412]
MPRARKNAFRPHMDALYSTLRYGKAEEPAKFKELDKDIHAYFTAYEDQVNILRYKDTLSDQIVLCATNYLTEESRVAYFCSITNVQCPEKSEAKSRLSENKQRRKSAKRRRRDESDDDDIDSAELLEGLSETTVKPWNEPLKVVTAFTIEWLKAENSPWLEVADVKLYTFMHNCEFYVYYDYSGGPTLDLIDILRKGSEIETLENGLLYVEFQNRIRDWVEFLTHQLTKAPYFVLEFRLTPKPPNRRRKLNGQKKAGSPVTFPNLCRPPIATPETNKLASLAGTALQMTTRESEEDMADESMLDLDLDEQGAMFVSDAFAMTSPRTTNRSRSISPETSIVVDSLGRSNEGATDTSPSWSSFREKALDVLPREPAAQDRDDVSYHESGSQLSTCPPSEPSNSMSSTDYISAGNQPRPRSSRECGPEISDDRSDEDSGQFIFVDDSGNR